MIWVRFLCRYTHWWLSLDNIKCFWLIRNSGRIKTQTIWFENQILFWCFVLFEVKKSIGIASNQVAFVIRYTGKFFPSFVKRANQSNPTKQKFQFLHICISMHRNGKRSWVLELLLAHSSTRCSQLYFDQFVRGTYWDNVKPVVKCRGNSIYLPLGQRQVREEEATGNNALPWPEPTHVSLLVASGNVVLDRI
jgi:hypothetical protein